MASNSETQKQPVVVTEDVMTELKKDQDLAPYIVGVAEDGEGVVVLIREELSPERLHYLNAPTEHLGRPIRYMEAGVPMAQSVETDAEDLR